MSIHRPVMQEQPYHVDSTVTRPLMHALKQVVNTHKKVSLGIGIDTHPTTMSIESHVSPGLVEVDMFKRNQVIANINVASQLSSPRHLQTQRAFSMIAPVMDTDVLRRPSLSMLSTSSCMTSLPSSPRIDNQRQVVSAWTSQQECTRQFDRVLLSELVASLSEVESLDSMLPWKDVRSWSASERSLRSQSYVDSLLASILADRVRVVDPSRHTGVTHTHIPPVVDFSIRHMKMVSCC